MKKIIAVVLLFVLPFTGFAEVSRTATGINADFKDVTLEDALLEIANAFDIEIKTTGDLSEKVTVGYSNSSIEKVLNSLLDDYNAMYFRNEQSGEIERVRIFSGKGVVLAPKPEEKAEGGEKVPPVPPEQLAEFRNGAFYMKVKINGATMEYLVDTGATLLTIRRADAFILSLPIGEEVEITTANGKIKGSMTTVNNVEMAGLQLKDVDAVIVDDLAVGLVGQNLLANYQVIQAKNTMRLIPTANVEGQAPPASNNADPNQAPQGQVPQGQTPQGQTPEGQTPQGQPANTASQQSVDNAAANQNPSATTAPQSGVGGAATVPSQPASPAPDGAATSTEANTQ